MYRVELSVLDKGAVLSVTESRDHQRYLQALNRARSVASSWATRYGFQAPKHIAGGLFLISDATGRTVAQTAVRDQEGK